MAQQITDGPPPARPGEPSGVFGRRPTGGAGAAGKAVVTDLTELVKAEIDLAKAELAEGVKTKALGGGLMAAAGVLVAIAFLGLLITAGLALALVMPGWAAALTVSVALIVIAVILALVGRAALAKPISIENTKNNVQEDVAWTKAHLPRK